MFRLALLSLGLAACLFAQDRSLRDILATLADERSVAAEADSVPVNPPGNSTACQVASKPGRCVVQDDLIHPDLFVPVFRKENGDTLQIDRREWPEAAQFMVVNISEGRTSWLPASRVESAGTSAADIVRLAKSREAFNCWEHHCYVMYSVQSGDAELFARCATTEIDGLRAFPKDCSPLLFQKKDKVWLKAVTEYKFIGINPPAPISDTITVKAAKALGIDEAVLIGAVDTALTKDPFVFEKRSIRGGYNSLLAVANPRPSKILAGGWFEWPTVGVNPSGLTLYIDCDLAVNKYNTSQPTDWHLPTQVQQTTYCSALLQHISNAVESVCKKFGTVTRQGTNRLDCEPAASKVELEIHNAR